MKFKIAMMVLILTALTAVQAKAQSFEFGFESGMNFSTLMGSGANSLSPTGTTSSRLGFVGGGFLSLNFSPAFAIKPELLYEQKGAQISGTTTDLESDYIEIPVLVKIGLGMPGLNPSIIAGPSFDWNTVTSLPSSAGTVNTSDVGLVGGLEFDFSKFNINARYELGLNNATALKNVSNGTLTILMGYSFI